MCTDRAMPLRGGAIDVNVLSGRLGIEDSARRDGALYSTKGARAGAHLQRPRGPPARAGAGVLPRLVFIGHESEIPVRGDYCLRYIGQRPFIFVRDEQGEIRVLFDGCRHRGALVCRAEKGNASHFRCSYHGWTYKNTGELIGAPRSARPTGTSKRRSGGYSGAQVDSVHGFVFATLDADAPRSTEYLGDFRWYMDVMWGLADNGLEVVGEPQRWVMEANWKQGADELRRRRLPHALPAQVDVRDRRRPDPSAREHVRLPRPRWERAPDELLDRARRRRPWPEVWLRPRGGEALKPKNVRRSSSNSFTGHGSASGRSSRTSPSSRSRSRTIRRRCATGPPDRAPVAAQGAERGGGAGPGTSSGRTCPNG